MPLAASLPQSAKTNRIDTLLAWYFVLVWGAGYLASKIGLQHAATFTFLSLRFGFGLLCMIPVVVVTRPRWPRDGREWFHVCVAGLLLHAANLGGSHSAQYLGMSAGMTALVLGLQPLLTAGIVAITAHESLRPRQWLGITLGLAGVALVVWHKIDLRAISTASLLAVLISLLSITGGTLYQRYFCKNVDLRSAALIQFAVAMLAVLPLGWMLEDMVIAWTWKLIAVLIFLVVFTSIFGLNALHYLMRRGQATRVTSLLYLTPIIAVILEAIFFKIVPSPVTIFGIAVTCCGVALVARR